MPAMRSSKERRSSPAAPPLMSIPTGTGTSRTCADTWSISFLVPSSVANGKSVLLSGSPSSKGIGLSSTNTRGAFPCPVLGRTVASIAVTPGSSPITTRDGPCRMSAICSSPPPASGTLSVAVSGSGCPRVVGGVLGAAHPGRDLRGEGALVDVHAHLDLQRLQV